MQARSSIRKWSALKRKLKYLAPRILRRSVRPPSTTISHALRILRFSVHLAIPDQHSGSATSAAVGPTALPLPPPELNIKFQSAILLDHHPRSANSPAVGQPIATPPPLGLCELCGARPARRLRSRILRRSAPSDRNSRSGNSAAVGLRRYNLTLNVNDK